MSRKETQNDKGNAQPETGTGQEIPRIGRGARRFQELGRQVFGDDGDRIRRVVRTSLRRRTRSARPLEAATPEETTSQTEIVPVTDATSETPRPLTSSEGWSKRSDGLVGPDGRIIQIDTEHQRFVINGEVHFHGNGRPEEERVETLMQVDDARHAIQLINQTAFPGESSAPITEETTIVDPRVVRWKTYDEEGADPTAPAFLDKLARVYGGRYGDSMRVQSIPAHIASLTEDFGPQQTPMLVGNVATNKLGLLERAVITTTHPPGEAQQGYQGIRVVESVWNNGRIVEVFSHYQAVRYTESRYFTVDGPTGEKVEIGPVPPNRHQ